MRDSAIGRDWERDGERDGVGGWMGEREGLGWKSWVERVYQTLQQDLLLAPQARLFLVRLQVLLRAGGCF